MTRRTASDHRVCILWPPPAATSSVSLRRRPCASADAQLCSKPDYFDSPGRLFWQRQEDSNHHQRFWRPPLYPLSYTLMKRVPPEKTPRCSPQTYTSITWCRSRTDHPPFAGLPARPDTSFSWAGHAPRRAPSIVVVSECRLNGGRLKLFVPPQRATKPRHNLSLSLRQFKDVGRSTFGRSTFGRSTFYICVFFGLLLRQ